MVIGRDIAIIFDELRKQKRPISICEHRSPLAREILLCEQRRTDHRGYQRQLHFSISLEFSLVEKCHACFIKKISQLKSDIPSCRCKNFSLKVVSVRSDGGVRTPRTLPLDPPLCHHRPSLHHDLLRLLRNGTKLPISPEEDHPS